MQKRRIYLIRHAQPYFPDGKKRYLGRTDPPLSPQGISQAKGLARGLAQFRLSGLCCSGLIRARQTAAIIAEQLGMEFRALEDLCELHMGTWEGMTFDEVRTRYPESFKQRRENIAHYRTPGGESFADLSKRVLPVFFGFVETSTGNIAIVSHAGVNRVILCSLMSLPLEKVLTLEQHYAAVNVIEKKGPSFSVLEMNRALTCPL